MLNNNLYLRLWLVVLTIAVAYSLYAILSIINIDEQTPVKQVVQEQRDAAPSAQIPAVNPGDPASPTLESTAVEDADGPLGDDTPIADDIVIVEEEYKDEDDFGDLDNNQKLLNMALANQNPADCAQISDQVLKQFCETRAAGAEFNAAEEDAVLQEANNSPESLNPPQ